METNDFKIRTFLNSLGYLVEQFKASKLPPEAQTTLGLLEKEIAKFGEDIQAKSHARSHSGGNYTAGRIKNVLVVDDNDINLLVLKAILDNLGIETQSATTAKQVLQIMRSGKTFDCFFLDLQMPEMDGFDLAQRLKLLPEVSRTPMVAVTALTGEEIEARVRAVGFDLMITKPISKAAILAALSTISES